MKRVIVTFFATVVLALSALPAMADEQMVTIRKSMLITGEHQRYIPYPFEVPSVSCGNLEVKELKKSEPFWGKAGTWEKKFYGEKAPAGWYYFKLTGADLSQCAPVMDFSVQVPAWRLNADYIGSFMEVEPEDLGLLVKGGVDPRNAFNLSTDDRQYSYLMVVMGLGTERSLDSFAHDTHFFSDSGKIVGAIISDERGFLTKKVMFKSEAPKPKWMTVPIFSYGPLGKRVGGYQRIALPPDPVVSAADVVVREGDVVVLIKQEL